MKPLVIFGHGEIAELADYYFREEERREVVAFTVDAAFLPGPEVLGRPMLAFETLEEHFPPEAVDLFVAIGFSRLNTLRRAKVEAAAARGYRLASYVSARASRFKTFTPGENQFILEDNTIQPFATIGRNVTLWSGNHIGHHARIGEDCFIASHVVVSGGVTIGPRCFVGVNVTIRDHVTIGADCVLGAGAVVMKSLPDRSVLITPPTEIAKITSDQLRRI
ncbi:acetyltransferase [Roseomonas sp. GC11]|uniref:acetyltransferase n=1 Tax=Roseomonas sp. GC11 TaxID=2950546 RepID=UPI00210B36C9|nr:acetyltransferase [Roseomonas sp. GC11]MCQ4161685.1 acetyltransferase [Roseomonas sp. GC11]